MLCTFIPLLSHNHMYIQEISIDLNKAPDKETIAQEFNGLMIYYRGSGQTQGKIEPLYIKDNRIISTPFTLEKDALDKKYNNFYVQEQSKKVEALSQSVLMFKMLGMTQGQEITACSCTQPKSYILITNYISIDPPLMCGTCHEPVPLYKLPVYHDHGYMPILSWETNYKSCDSLQMNCEVGERWALNQMQEPDSQLSRQGRTICHLIEDETGIPTYYYLHNYRRTKRNTSDHNCPGCNEAWLPVEHAHNIPYDFRCDQCRLVSVISPNV